MVERILLTADIALLLFKEEMKVTVEEEEEEGGMGDVTRGIDEDEGASGREEERGRGASVVVAVLPSDFFCFDFAGPWLSPTINEIK